MGNCIDSCVPLYHCAPTEPLFGSSEPTAEFWKVAPGGTSPHPQSGPTRSVDRTVASNPLALRLIMRWQGESVALKIFIELFNAADTDGGGGSPHYWHQTTSQRSSDQQ